MIIRDNNKYRVMILWDGWGNWRDKYPYYIINIWLSILISFILGSSLSNWHRDNLYYHRNTIIIAINNWK